MPRNEITNAEAPASVSNTTKLRGYLQVKHNPTSRKARLPRKAWKRQWVVLDIVETLDCPALIGRVYNSHMHEDRTLPCTTVTLADVHALHRTQSRSHPFAFSLDGSCQCLVLSGNSETESQLWMRQIRDLLWPRALPPPLWPSRTDSVFEVSLIDNVHSDIARLRGFYGQLLVDGRDILLVEARSGADQIRWPIKSLKKWFCARVAVRQDRDKIVVIITHKNCSSGEGIFTFFCNRAKELVQRLHFASKNQPLSSLEGKRTRMNPLMALLRRSSNRGRPSSKRQLMGKSVSVIDQLSVEQQSGGFEGRPHQPPVALTAKRGLSLDRSLSAANDNEKKKSASESDLLNAQASEGHEEEFPAPPPDDELTRLSVSATTEGFYRSFDDLDDMDDYLANSNALEAAVVLRHGGEANQGCIGNNSSSNNGRCSFNSSDSGRMSDTYAETSNSSVTSSSHVNMCSNTSNCSSSADSGAHSDKVLEVLKEQESPEYPPPFDQGIYGKSVAIKNDSSPRYATVRKSRTLPHNNPSNDINAKRKDLSNFFGLNDEGPGSPTREVAQQVAMQNLQSTPTYKVDKYLGISSTSTEPRRPRPKGLTLNKTLARLQHHELTAQSAPTTPECPSLPSSQDETSPRRKNLAKFLGLNGTLKLSKSTPLDLQNEDNYEVPVEQQKKWQSNDGLATPGSVCMTPSGSPPAVPRAQRPSLSGLVLRVGPVEQTRATSSASSSPYHTMNNSVHTTRSLQRGGLGPLNRGRSRGQVPQRRGVMSRSATIDQIQVPPVMWVQRSGSKCHPCCCGQWAPPNSVGRRSASVACQVSPTVSKEQPVYLTMNKNKNGVVVIPVQGSTTNVVNVGAFEEPLRESSVDPDYLDDTNVVSVGGKTCISVNDAQRPTIVSTKAIVHQAPSRMQ